MEKSTIINYVCEHALVSELVTHNNYSVRFPYPNSSMIFTASDPETLVDRVWNYVNTTEGRNLIVKRDFTEYTDEFYVPSGDEE